METPVDCHGLTDIGRKRKSNQDQYLIADLRRSMKLCDTSIPHEHHQRLVGNRPGKLFVVADGMGGQAGGERASSIVIRTITGHILNMMHWFLKLNDDYEDDFKAELAAALSACQKQLRSDARQHPEFGEMGTTVTLAYIVWPRMYVVHAGDSRCYVLRDGRLDQITTDHSMAQAMVDSGLMKPEDAATSRLRHSLWNAVGANGDDVQPEIHKVILKEGDTVLMCSDGLHGMLNDDGITKCLAAENASSELIAEHLIAAANNAGGSDNITAVVARFLTNPSLIDECGEHTPAISQPT